MEPRRRWSRELPPDLSELMNTLIKYANEFIHQFDGSERRMRRIVREFKKIADEVRSMQEATDSFRKGGAVAAGVGLGLGIVFAPFTGGLSLLAAAPGAATVVGSNVTKVFTEKEQAEKVEELGQDFMNKVKPMKKTLEEIKKTCEELEEQSRKHQAERALRNVEEFRDILGRISRLKLESKGLLQIIVEAITSFDGLLGLILAIFRVTPTPEEDEKLRAAIIQSSHQCEKVTDGLEKMKDKVRDFTGH